MKTVLFTRNMYVQKSVGYLQRKNKKMNVYSQKGLNYLHVFTKYLQFLVLLLHPRLHGLDATVALGNRLPARTRVYLRELGRQEIVRECGRDFFGDTCFEAHRSKTHDGKTAEVHQRSICFNKRRCTGCRKLETRFKYIKRHRCGYLDCPSCQEYVNAQTHKYFIQKALSPQEKKEQKKERKRKQQQKRGPPAKRGAAAGLQTLRANEGGDDDFDESDDDEEPPPLHVFFDIEAMQPQEQHVANLVVAETEEDPRPVRFQGEHCLRDFLEWLDTLTQEDTRPVNVLAHNFQGYDGYFVVNQYHFDNQKIQQIRNGYKLLEVQHDKIRFIDSLSFFKCLWPRFPKPLDSRN